MIILFLFGCSSPSKTRLTDDELRWISIYKAGDTLVFKSSRGQYDTIYITESKDYYPEFIPIEVHNEYLPHSGVVIYSHSSLHDSIVNERLVYIVKKNPEDRTQLFINLLNAKFISVDINTIKRISSGHELLYELDTYHPKANSGEPRMIYWKKDSGIVKYITHDSEVWQIYKSNMTIGM
jgi:hypothetical protein